jgi:drug/metabolite transporter (DMT)-like permease
MGVTDVSAAPAEAGVPRAVVSPAWIGWAAALAAITAFSIATPIARAALVGGMDPNALLVSRMVLATLLMGATIAVSHPERLGIGWRAVGIALGAGLVNAFGMVCYFIGLARLESSMAAMLISLSPLAVLSLLALRGEKVTYRHAVRLVLALTGVYLLIGPGGDVDLAGVLWIFVSLWGFALQLVLMQWHLLGYDARAVTFYVLIGMTAGVVAWWMAMGMPWDPPGVPGWTTILILAVVSTYAARLLQFSAVTRIGGGQTSMLSPVETLLAVIWSMLFLGERLSLIQAAGGVLILLSAILAMQRLKRARFRPRWRLWVRT